jgi:hypothetical protein
MAQCPPAPILFMDLQGLDQSEAVLDRAIGQLAEVAVQ